ncbi:PleD family two-component system response regulator [Halobacteriovorax sp. HLS]|uniref:response regulator n=1 Tax=Halobacteriovorax sp. HLS TaxID=2234000 RepID=UPI000FD7B5A8|nr:response regulator [Halobacteriovorax sp. HLS]
MEDFEIEFKLSTLNELEDLFADFFDILKVNSPAEITDENVDAIFRIVHSVKGNSKACEFESMSTISHEFEDLMLKVKENKIEFCQNIFDLCFNFCDEITQVIEETQKDLDYTHDFNELSQKFKNFVPYVEETQETSPEQEPPKKLEIVKTERVDEDAIKILLVDDDSDLTELISSYIKVYFPAIIKITRDGNEASKSCMRVDYDTIICDYQMPIMNGQTFVKELRENYSLNQKTPVIFLSALEPDLIPSSEVWDEVFFVKKPVTKKELIYYLRCAIETKKQREIAS